MASEALRGGREARAERATLAPVRLLELAGPASGGGLEIQLVSGDRLIVRERVAVELLRETLSVLRGGC